MGFFIFGKAHTGSLYGFLPSADIGQVVYYTCAPQTLSDQNVTVSPQARSHLSLEALDLKLGPWTLSPEPQTIAPDS